MNQAAKRLDWHPETVRQAIRAGRLKAEGGGRRGAPYKISTEELDRFQAPPGGALPRASYEAELIVHQRKFEHAAQEALVAAYRDLDTHITAVERWLTIPPTGPVPKGVDLSTSPDWSGYGMSLQRLREAIQVVETGLPRPKRQMQDVRVRRLAGMTFEQIAADLERLKRPISPRWALELHRAWIKTYGEVDVEEIEAITGQKVPAANRRRKGHGT